MAIGALVAGGVALVTGLAIKFAPVAAGFFAKHYRDKYKSEKTISKSKDNVIKNQEKIIKGYQKLHGE